MSNKLPINLTKKDIKLNSPSRTCEFCRHTFSQRCSLLRHLKKQQCKSKILQSKSESVIVPQLQAEIKELKEQFKKQTEQTNRKFAELEHNPPNVINNNLQIVCVGNKDNYLDMLTHELNSFDKALEYIKECALSSVIGDCKLIEKIYLRDKDHSEQFSIRFVDQKKTRVEYYNEKEEIVTDSKETFGRKLANNLQNSYLKGVNHLINKNLENRRCPNKFLEEYDLQVWNQHIYELSDLKYQKKIMNQLDIPMTRS